MSDGRESCAADPRCWLNTHRQHSLRNQLAGHGSDDMHTQDLIIILGGNELREALRLLHRPRATAGEEGNTPVL